MLARSASAMARFSKRGGVRGIVFSAKESVTIPETPLTEFLLEHADKQGSKPALVDGVTKDTIAYNELSTRIGSAAAALADAGFKAGDTLAVLLPNCIEYPVLFNAAAVAGGRVTTVNPQYTAKEVLHQLNDSGASIVVTNEACAAVAEEAAGMAQTKARVLKLEDAANGLREDRGIQAATHADVNPRECLALPYSSGTTGLPKGTMLSAHNLVANISQVVNHPTFNLDMTADDTVLGLLPAFHIYASTVVFQTALRVGATVVTLPHFDPAVFLGTMKQHNVSWAPLVPPLIHFMGKHPAVAEVKLPSLRVIFSGAAPLDAEAQLAVEARFPQCSVRQGYGMTELSPVSHMTHPQHVRAGSVGFVVPGCEAKFIKDDGEEAGVGEVGELCVRGPNVMLGYLNNEEATRQTLLADGFLRTGDVGYSDEDGHTFIVDRVKELIKVKGFQVAPAELEGLLHSVEGVADAAVIGLPHERDGERPHAFLVRADSEAGANLTAEGVTAALAADTVDYKHLASVTFIDAVPKSASGKILRRVLKQQALEQQKSA